MGEVVLRDRFEVGQFRAVPGQDGAPRSEVDERLHRRQVVAQVAVRCVENRGAAAEDGVGGEHRSLPLDHERHRVGGVPRCTQHPQGEPGGLDQFVVVETAATAAPELLVHGTHRRTGQFEEPVDATGVVVMTMRDQRQHNGPDAGDPRQVVGVVVTGVDHDALVAPRGPQDPGVGAVERVHARILLEHDGGDGRDLAQLAYAGCWSVMGAPFVTDRQRTRRIRALETDITVRLRTAAGRATGHLVRRRCTHIWVPPSIRISVPVTNLPSSEASIAITPATSSGGAKPSPIHGYSLPIRLGSTHLGEARVARHAGRDAAGLDGDGAQTLLGVLERDRCVKERIPPLWRRTRPCTGARSARTWS